MSADVLLLSMPFAPLCGPSLALSLLKAGLGDVRCKVIYFTLPFAEHVCGFELYKWISDGHPATTSLLGEWIFSSALFESDPREHAAYFDEVLRQEVETRPLLPRQEREVLRLRQRLDGFLDDCLEEVLSHAPRIVGFTSVFQQHVASLALARRLKAAAPNVTVVFGGANCETVMGTETMAQFPWVDVVVSGEGDVVFPQLVERLLGGGTGGKVRGVVARDGVPGAVRPASLLREMDRLPYPDYGDFFEQWNGSSFHEEYAPWLSFETSRGCWWGEKQHCTFCGLNGAGMAFRSKSPERAHEELSHLARQYPGLSVQVTDNILDMKYFTSLIPRLAKDPLGVDLFYETKANLKKKHLYELRAAGVTRIQPGIESLSDGVLALMKKGVTALQSIRLLKWCREVGIRPSWNLIWGFPGEDPEEYARMADIVPWLTHLTPPERALPIRLDRFSPNFEQAEELGFTEVSPCPAYRHVYPLEEEAVKNLAYFFRYRYREDRDVASYTAPLAEQVSRWKEAHSQSVLFHVDRGERLLVWDHRPARTKSLTILDGFERELFLACDEIRSLSYLATKAERLCGCARPRERVEEILRPLVDSGLMVRDGHRVLALSVDPSGA